VSSTNKRESAKGRRPNYLEEALYCIGTLQFHGKLARITQNDVSRCFELLTNIKNPGIVSANLKQLVNQGFVTRVSAGDIDLGYRLTPRGVAYFAILDCLAIYVLVPTIIKFIINKAKEAAEAASEEIKVDLRRAWAENYEFREKALHMFKQKYRESISIMPIIIKMIEFSVHLEIMRPGGAGKQQRLRNYLEILNLISSALNDSSASMSFQASDPTMVYRGAMDMCSLALGVENVGIEALRNYVDDLVHNNTTVATA
jgi:DNA-binding HxlR family transcriptional regulator